MGLRRGHVPYRNSTLTSVLRDSLGGNCRTAMIATVQPSAAQIEESIATCRFAQRVAMISNRIAVNEEARAVLFALLYMLPMRLSHAAGCSAFAPGDLG